MDEENKNTGIAMTVHKYTNTHGRHAVLSTLSKTKNIGPGNDQE
jgi:hypothetical protein